MQQQLCRRLAAVPRVEPRRKRRADEKTPAPASVMEPDGTSLILWLVSADVSVIVASHNTRAYLERCLRLLGESHEVIVVDTLSSDGSQALVRDRFPHARLVELDENPGYGGALNRGIVLASGRYLLLMNGDAWPQEGAVERLVAFAESEPRAGVVGPRLVNPDGTLQPSVRGFPTLWRLATEYLFLRWLAPRSRLLNAFYGAGFDHRSQRDAEFLVGAVLLVRRETLDEVGGFDERFFMFNEEVDLCYRVRAAGWTCRLLARSGVRARGRSFDGDELASDVPGAASLPPPLPRQARWSCAGRARAGSCSGSQCVCVLSSSESSAVGIAPGCPERRPPGWAPATHSRFSGPLDIAPLPNGYRVIETRGGCRSSFNRAALLTVAVDHGVLDSRPRWGRSTASSGERRLTTKRCLRSPWPLKSVGKCPSSVTTPSASPERRSAM